MGLLDDAIRQHLELKRKHGADPAEVAQQEREAFGPARGPASDAPPDAEPGAAGAVSAGLGEPGPDEPPGPETALSRDAEPDIEWSEPAPLRASDPAVGDEPASRSAPAEVPPEDALEDAGDPTVEHRRDDERPLADEAVSPEAEGAEDVGGPPAQGDDVLDETPEFLQETPEHDRLWFEQKPPRDFDF